MKPTLTSFKARWTKFRLTLQFSGEHLDCIQGRGIQHPISIDQASPSDLPFLFTSGGLKVVPGVSKIIRILSISAHDVTIELINTDLEEQGALMLITDFGETNTFVYDEKDIIRGEEATPSKSLHPTMNVDLLSAAILRVVIYCKPLVQPGLAKGLEEALEGNTELHTLWTLLLSLEKELCPSSNTASHGLSVYVTKYLQFEIDLAVMKTHCVAILENMSAKIVEEFHFQETIFAWGGRKLSGMCVSSHVLCFQLIDGPIMSSQVSLVKLEEVSS
jgi:hypothetical protein